MGSRFSNMSKQCVGFRVRGLGKVSPSAKLERDPVVYISAGAVRLESYLGRLPKP